MTCPNLNRRGGGDQPPFTHAPVCFNSVGTAGIFSFGYQYCEWQFSPAGRHQQIGRIGQGPGALPHFLPLLVVLGNYTRTNQRLILKCC